MNVYLCVYALLYTDLGLTGFLVGLVLGGQLSVQLIDGLLIECQKCPVSFILGLKTPAQAITFALREIQRVWN